MRSLLRVLLVLLCIVVVIVGAVLWRFVYRHSLNWTATSIFPDSKKT